MFIQKRLAVCLIKIYFSLAGIIISRINVLIFFFMKVYLQLSQLMRLWYLSRKRPAKAQASLRIARAFAVHIDEVWKLKKDLPENQTSSPTGCLRMRV